MVQMVLGCGSVGGADTSDARVPWFETIYCQILFTFNCIEKMIIKKKEAGNGPIVLIGFLFEDIQSVINNGSKEVIWHSALFFANSAKTLAIKGWILLIK